MLKHEGIVKIQSKSCTACEVCEAAAPPFFNPPPLKLGEVDQKCAIYGGNDLKVHILAIAMISMGKRVLFVNCQ